MECSVRYAFRRGECTATDVTVNVEDGTGARRRRSKKTKNVFFLLFSAVWPMPCFNASILDYYCYALFLSICGLCNKRYRCDEWCLWMCAVLSVAVEQIFFGKTSFFPPFWKSTLVSLGGNAHVSDVSGTIHSWLCWFYASRSGSEIISVSHLKLL